MTVNEWIENGGYERMKTTLQRYEVNRGGVFDEDIYHATLLRMMQKEKYADTTKQGYDNYCFRAYTINVMRELQYPRITRTVYVDDITPYQSIGDDSNAWWLLEEIVDEFGVDRLNAVINGYDDEEILNWLKKNVY